jgi:N-glycosyltransferase
MVHVTLGTVFNKFPGIFQVLVAGATPHAAEVLVTVGSNLDPSVAGSVPTHVRVERYVPLSQILPDCDLVVAHAGWNTLMACSAAGVPVIALVVGADHQGNADAGAVAGWVMPLAARALTAAAVGEAVQRALADKELRDAAFRSRSALEALPSPTEVASSLADRFGH